MPQFRCCVSNQIYQFLLNRNSVGLNHKVSLLTKQWNNIKTYEMDSIDRQRDGQMNCQMDGWTGAWMRKVSVLNFR